MGGRLAGLHNFEAGTDALVAHIQHVAAAAGLEVVARMAAAEEEEDIAHAVVGVGVAAGHMAVEEVVAARMAGS